MCFLEIIIGSDEAGFGLKNTIKACLEGKGIKVEDVGAYSTDRVDYPDITHGLAKAVSEGKFERDILICGTGIGMAIVANKLPDGRAACCHDTYSAHRARMSNNA